MEMRKKLGIAICIVLLGIFVIEGGMRFAIWRSLNELVPVGVKYELSITIPDASGHVICLDSETKNYIGVFYTKWFLSMFWSSVTCRYKSSYMNLVVYDYDTSIGHVYMTNYHWSFYSMGFVEHVMYSL
ncbi:hypothetical protein [Rahnella woolbedingensis]|uniref:Uncharacterized protein n=1 Tax=Rahnella woolbedingensis TaxID=1510574 RepID=A0A419N743_9GAMM|nr:hypothetical protein [Rahnella woolbedingensis]RJT43006.1 hypothetical protein D6C13_15955 [Rahnella woolbedingensis]